MDNQLLTIAQNYKSQYHIDDWHREIKDFYSEVVREREQSVIDAAAATAAVNALFLSDNIDFGKITPQMEEAFNLAYPNVELESLSNCNPDEVMGYLSGWKGKYFEILVRDKLNEGNWIGDIHLQTGQYAEIAESITQPGWDLQILNEDGSIADALQIKATNSLSYIQKALEKYPDIDIISTSEVFNQSEILTDHLINSNVSNDDLTAAIKAPMESLCDSGIEEFFEDILPGLPFLIIAFSEGHKVMVGKKSFEIAFADGLERAFKTGLSMSVGALVYLLDGGFLSLPASFLTRISFDRIKISSIIQRKIDKELSSLKQLLLEF